ncbi:MAG TPA: bifunctional hydroxymethylpyrimidine kinase/phosphomethylpyrimidine kinase [Elusimicrobia bacterium]|nr:bifunctional hydroxymethylpyrimidine kinase/phosphomethylpyrimidine kinase [Elusimicrobiota bacterium]
MKRKRLKTVLCIAASDPSCGAGIQADIKTASALGCYALSALSALTIQNTTGVFELAALPPCFISGQLKALAEDITIDAVKIGAIASEGAVLAIADFLRKKIFKNIVADPVIAASDGFVFLRRKALLTYKKKLLPLTDIITPNIPEAELLSGIKISRAKDMEEAAVRIADLGVGSVLVKGGHSRGKTATDCLYLPDTKRMIWFGAPRINTPNSHGTGCALSTAIASCLASGADTGEGMIKAVKSAKEFLNSALAGSRNYKLGAGRGPLNHFYNYKQNRPQKL